MLGQDLVQFQSRQYSLDGRRWRFKVVEISYFRCLFPDAFVLPFVTLTSGYLRGLASRDRQTSLNSLFSYEVDLHLKRREEK